MDVEMLLEDRRGEVTRLAAEAGEPVLQTLLRNLVPPPTVAVSCDGVPVPDSHRLQPGARYHASLIEGYDIGTILSVLTDGDGGGGAYVKKRLLFTDEGRLGLEQTALSMAGAARLVEQTVRETVNRFGLIQPDAPVVLGLSGGVDSGSLMLALGAILEKGEMPFRLIAATFQDYDSRYSDTFDRARRLAVRFGVEHHLVGEDVCQSTFHLKRPLRQILPALMETEDAHQTMYVDHHTTRRTLEVFAQTQGSATIALGLHTTDLLAGLLNAQASGYRIGAMPLRPVGDFTYIFPLAFVQKRELHLYHQHHTGQVPKHSPVNPWEFNPLDRNFYYYLADFMQALWPGAEHWMLTNPLLDSCRQPADRYAQCGNCGGAIDTQDRPWNAGDFCDACSVLARYGYVEGV